MWVNSNQQPCILICLWTTTSEFMFRLQEHESKQFTEHSATVWEKMAQKPWLFRTTTQEAAINPASKCRWAELGGTEQQTYRRVCCSLIIARAHRRSSNPQMAHRGESSRWGDWWALICKARWAPSITVEYWFFFPFLPRFFGVFFKCFLSALGWK